MKSLEKYNKLWAIGKKTSLLRSINLLLSWDEETYMTPGSTGMRSDQSALLASLAHDNATSLEFEELLSELIDLKTGKILAHNLDDIQQAALREWRHDLALHKKIPSSLVAEESKLSTQAADAWKKAKGENDFSIFSPYLEKIVDLMKKKADCIGYDDHPYNAMLEIFEPGMTVKILDKIFGELRPALTEMTNTLTARKKTNRAFLFEDFPQGKIMELSQELMKTVGLNPETSRLDTAAHPFCMTGHPENVRLTVFKNPHGFFDTISALMHEAGHGLYEQGMNKEYFGTPICKAISFGIHESQSMFWENFIGKSKPFCTYLLPKLKEILPQLANISTDEFYNAINHVHPSPIRVSADDVTYSLHIILRYEIERALIDGSLAVKDIPAVWNEKMHSFLGITPKNDAEGCLQDVHWSCCFIGYFPSYALGNLYAAQWFNLMKAEIPGWETQVAQGDMSAIAAWLKETIHKHGRRYTADELTRNLTGEPLSAKPFINHLEQKFSI
jgi:carboxypeptidase Taq